MIPVNAPARRLVIAPHCDDETLGCGGLLAKYPNETTVVIVSEPDEVRAKEFRQAAEILGYATYEFLDFEDGRIGVDMHSLVEALDHVVARYEPTELYLPFPSMHQDHVAVYEAGVRAGRLSMSVGHWFTPTVLVYDVAAYDVILYPTDLRWNLFESLDEEHINRKVAALEAYGSQTVTGPHPANSVKQQAQVLGASRQIEFAEQYALVRGVRQ
jgi:LmbE family N-acetylglucosaminyl deacetylase